MPLVRVLEIPETDGEFRFNGGQDQIFREVDWFRDDHFPLTAETEIDYRSFLSNKQYNRGQPLLVLHPGHSFTINYPRNSEKED